MNDRPAKGIRRTGSGWQVYVRVRGEFRSKHFPPDTDLLTLKTHRSRMQARGWLAQPEPDATGDDFAADVVAYLKLKATMPSIKDRTYHLHQWRDTIGAGRNRADITDAVIGQQLEKWRAGGLSHGACNRRRTALMSFYTVMNGKSGHNPVRDVPKFRETPGALNLPTIRQATKAIGAFGPLSKSKPRLLVLLWTGWPPAQLKQITCQDIDWKAHCARLPPRRKGEGAAARVLPLLPQAVAALRLLDRREAWGAFSVQSLRARLHRACKRAKVTPFNVKTLRHLFLTTVALATKDDRVVAELAQHSNLTMARRYTEQSVNPRLAAGLKLVGRALKRRA